MSCMTTRCMISKVNHVKFVCSVLLNISKEAKKITPVFFVSFFCRSMYNKTIIRFVFVISKIISLSLSLQAKFEVRVIS